MLAGALLTVASLLPAQIPAAPVGDVAARVEGKARLTCNTPWHQLDLTLKPRGRLHLGTGALKVFVPPVQARPGDTWTVRDEQLVPLARALHEVGWTTVPAQDKPRYDKWRGAMVSKQHCTVSGALTLKLVKAGEEYRLEFSGTLKAVDSGHLGNRFGPNSWHDQWTHEITGMLRLTEKGVPTAFELRDQFQVDGGYFTNPTAITDPSKRAGEFKATLVPLKPLPDKEVAIVKELINQLGAAKFADREQATKALEEMGASIIGVLREYGLTHRDVEVQRRVRALIDRLPDE